MRSGLLRGLEPGARTPATATSWHHGDVALAELVHAKGQRRISVCVPARNEGSTVGDIVACISDRLGTARAGQPQLVDEILVIDDHSTDDTASVAAAAGARVVDARTVLPEYGSGHGKGEVLWKSVFMAEGDLIIWCDADIAEFDERFITGIATPLIMDDEIAFSKGFYERPEANGVGGGRVTELVARPLLSMFFPQLSDIRQPLSGEYGGRRDVLEQLPFVQGYGVDVGLLIDIERRVGCGAIAQVDLDVRHHRNRPLSELSPQAMAVASTILHRAQPGLVAADAPLRHADGTFDMIDVAERPPLVELAAYLSRTA